CCTRMRCVSPLFSALPLILRLSPLLLFFFYNDPAPPEISTLSLHDALPILAAAAGSTTGPLPGKPAVAPDGWNGLSLSLGATGRSEEHTSELQSLTNLVCRLLLEKKKTNTKAPPHTISADIYPTLHAHTPLH